MSPSRKHACEIVRNEFRTGGYAVLASARLNGVCLLAITLVDPQFYFADGARPTREDFQKFARKFRRHCDRSKAVELVVGMLEMSFVQRADKSAIQLELHAVVAVKALSTKTALNLVKQVFKAKADRENGIYRPLKVTTIDKEKGGLRGLLGYISKSLEERGIIRRSSYLDKSGRWNTRDFSLRPAEQRDLDMIFESVGPQDQLILYGARRVKGKIVALA